MICKKCAHENYCDMAQFGGHVPPIMACPKFKEKSQTNADRIRAMTDEELAKLFDSWIQDCDCNDVPCHKSCEENNEKSVSGCINHWLDWLKEEAKDER